MTYTDEQIDEALTLLASAESIAEVRRALRERWGKAPARNTLKRWQEQRAEENQEEAENLALTLLQSDALRELSTHRLKLFVIYYVDTLNATKAARKAGYNATDPSLAQIGYINMNKPSVVRAIDQLLAERVMSEAEALNRMTGMARATIADCIKITENGSFAIDLKKARDNGAIQHIHELAFDKAGRPKIKMYDKKDALEKILKAHGTYRDESPRLEVKGGTVNVFTQVNVQQNQ